MKCGAREWRKFRSGKVTDEVLECIVEKRTHLHNILCRKANCIGHILRTNCLLYDVSKGKMTEVKGVGRRRRRRTQPHNDLRKRKRY